ncbi:MAG: hypothetical protein P9M14_04160 [Candidatus Alcyoniella australis]|nr:hypothetical protein [Candidatus Alcyoniella australis]
MIPIVSAAGPFDQTGIDKDDPHILGWASGYLDYLPADGVDLAWQHPEKALGPATGKHIDIVSLGERAQGSTEPPGEITLTFDGLISNGEGADIVVFENGFTSDGLLFAELSYVEVSTDGESFARFPCVSLIDGPVGAYGLIDPTDVFNLAGRHANAYDVSEGTGFDLEDLQSDALVLSGEVDLQRINFVRIVDVPGSGDYSDTATRLGYAQDNPIFDVYPTYGSGGTDLEAIGYLHGSTAADDDDSSDDDSDDDEDDDQVADDDDSADDDDLDHQSAVGSDNAACGS